MLVLRAVRIWPFSQKDLGLAVQEPQDQAQEIVLSYAAAAAVHLYTFFHVNYTETVQLCWNSPIVSMLEFDECVFVAKYCTFSILFQVNAEVQAKWT